MSWVTLTSKGCSGLSPEFSFVAFADTSKKSKENSLLSISKMMHKKVRASVLFFVRALFSQIENSVPVHVRGSC